MGDLSTTDTQNQPEGNLINGRSPGSDLMEVRKRTIFLAI